MKMWADSLPVIVPSEAPRVRSFDCADGLLTVEDVARAAHVTVKEAKRAMEAMVLQGHPDLHRKPHGVSIEVDAATVPHPASVTVADMARIVAEQLAIGVFGIRQRAVVRRAQRNTRLENQIMAAKGHTYRDKRGGRDLRTENEPGVGHVLFASMACSRDGCGHADEVKLRQLGRPEDIDRKFHQRGWTTDPALCPDHATRPISAPAANPRKEATIMAEPTRAAVQSQARMFRMISENFDPERGAYAAEWSDERIAKEVGLARDLVAAVRLETFGAIKEPAELAQLAADIATLASMIDDAVAPIRTELSAIRGRLEAARKKFAA